MKSRGVYETPGGTRAARGARGGRVDDARSRGPAAARQDLMPRYAGLVYNGFWFAPEREALQRLVDDIARRDHRHRAAAALQGRDHGARPQGAAQPVPARHRHVRGGRGLRPARRAGLHQAQRAADPDPQRAR